MSLPLTISETDKNTNQMCHKLTESFKTAYDFLLDFFDF